MVTFFDWPIRWHRAIACTSFWGFQSLYKWGGGGERAMIVKYLKGVRNRRKSISEEAGVIRDHTRNGDGWLELITYRR